MEEAKFSKVNNETFEQPSLENIELISFTNVQALVPLSKSRLYALMREGKFPKPVKIGDHRACWLKHEILAYLAERIAGRDSK